MNTNTLAQRIAEGRIPAPEALRYAMQIAEALRKLHDEGRVHGSVTPVSISLDRNSAELMPAMIAAGATTPYTAPEVMAGKTPDSRSDIFSFGAVVYEMLTGRRAFEGSDRSKPAPSGSPAVDRFVSGCLAIDPQGRLQSIKRVMMELKLLNAAARRAETPAVRSGADTALRDEVRQLEERTTARVQEQQKFVAEMQHAVTEAVATLRGQLSALSVELSSSRNRTGDVESAVESATGKIIGHVQQSVDSVSERLASVKLSVDAASVRIAAVEQGLLAANGRIERVESKPAPAAEIPASLKEAADASAKRVAQLEEATDASAKRVAQLEEALAAANQKIEKLGNQPAPQAANPEVFQALAERMSHLEDRLETVSKRSDEAHDTVSHELENFEKQLQSQTASIESARTAMAQTDDLVERVVEALESLQTIVLEQSGDRTTTLG